MNLLAKQRLRRRWLVPIGAAAVAALGLMLSLAPAAHADITYTKEISNWASSNDPGGRDASARLRASNGNVHYKALFRAYDEIITVYDHYDEGSVDYAASAEVKIWNTSGDLVQSSQYFITGPGQTSRSYELYYNGGYNVPEGYKIQMRLCRESRYVGPCTPWVYGIA
ncbi:MAG: hypothetical protein ACRDTM_14130 [Micromonosporaceae bacterium]